MQFRYNDDIYPSFFTILVHYHYVATIDYRGNYVVITKIGQPVANAMMHLFYYLDTMIAQKT